MSSNTILLALLSGKRMKILITGGTGMLGSAFKELKTNHEIFPIGSKHLYLFECCLSKNQQHNPYLLLHHRL